MAAGFCTSHVSQSLDVAVPEKVVQHEVRQLGSAEGRGEGLSCEPSAAHTPNIWGAVCTRGDTAEENVYEQLHNFTKNKSPSRKSKGVDIRHLNSSAVFNLFLILSEPWFSPSLKWG